MTRVRRATVLGLVGVVALVAVAQFYERRGWAADVEAVELQRAHLGEPAEPDPPLAPPDDPPRAEKGEQDSIAPSDANGAPRQPDRDREDDGGRQPDHERDDSDRDDDGSSDGSSAGDDDDRDRDVDRN